MTRRPLAPGPVTLTAIHLAVTIVPRRCTEDDARRVAWLTQIHYSLAVRRMPDMGSLRDFGNPLHAPRP